MFCRRRRKKWTWFSFRRSSSFFLLPCVLVDSPDTSPRWCHFVDASLLSITDLHGRKIDARFHRRCVINRCVIKLIWLRMFPTTFLRKGERIRSTLMTSQWGETPLSSLQFVLVLNTKKTQLAKLKEQLDTSGNGHSPVARNGRPHGFASKASVRFVVSRQRNIRSNWSEFRFTRCLDRSVSIADVRWRRTFDKEACQISEWWGHYQRRSMLIGLHSFLVAHRLFCCTERKWRRPNRQLIRLDWTTVIERTVRWISVMIRWITRHQRSASIITGRWMI